MYALGVDTERSARFRSDFFFGLCVNDVLRCTLLVQVCVSWKQHTYRHPAPFEGQTFGNELAGDDISHLTALWSNAYASRIDK